MHYKTISNLNYRRYIFHRLHRCNTAEYSWAASCQQSRRDQSTRLVFPLQHNLLADLSAINLERLFCFTQEDTSAVFYINHYGNRHHPH